MAKKPKVLEIRLSGMMADAPSRFAWARGERSSLYEVETALGRALRDDSIDGVFVDITDLHVGWSKAQSFHRAIARLREAGKATVSFLSGADNATYLMACACETIVLAPVSLLSFQALSSESLFFKDLLGEIGVEPEVDAVGEFKSAGEALERRESSEAHRKEMYSILEDLNDQLVDLVASARSLEPEAVRNAIASGPYVADDTKAVGLVDHVAHRDFAQSRLEDALGGEPIFVPHAKYAAPPGLVRRVVRWRKPQVAVVHASGVVTSGAGRSSPRGATLGATWLAELLSELRERRRVRAVVLRIESPGGSAVASDAIHRELSRLAEEKPVVVSMGDIAASGGYYIATAGTAVLAEGASLTGSIGVIGGKLVIKRVLDRLGIARETFSLGPNSGIFSALRAFTPEERDWHRAYLERFYRERFLAVVAEGRNLTLDEADDAGRGRVWTGRQSHGVGLVDRLGGLYDAIELAHDEAGLEVAKTNVVVHGRRARLRELLGLGLFEESLFGEITERFALIEELAKDELLLLMPRIFRIR